MERKIMGMGEKILILMMIMGIAVAVESSFCSNYCVEECFEARMIQQCIIQCMKTCKPPSASLAKHAMAMDCARGCANSNCKNIASGDEMTACVDSCSKNCNK